MTMLAADLARALDPALHMRAAGYPPDPWQATFLRSTALRSLVLCSRQTGKSTTTAALASHVAIYEPGALVLILAPSQQQSRELFRKVCLFHRETDTVDPEGESAQRMELANGSRIVSLSGNPTTARGFSGPKLVIIDEAAWVSDELFHAVTPMLAAGGRLLCLTTPNGRRGWFYDAWQEGSSAWSRTRVTADDSPRITPAFLSLERATKPEWRIQQEYFVQFVDNDEMLFPSAMVKAAITPAVAPLFSPSASMWS